MDDLILRLKIETDNTEKLADVNTQLKKSTDNANDSAKALSLNDTSVGKLFNSIKSGAEIGVKSFSSLKAAVASTGIGLLVIAVAAIVEWFSKTETGANALKDGMAALGQAIKEGPMAVFNAFKVVIDVFLLEVKTAFSVVSNFAKVLVGKESIGEAVGNVKKTFSDASNKIKEDAGKIVEAGNRILSAAKFQEKLNQLDKDRRDNEAKDKALEAEISALREKASDQDETRANRIAALNEAMKKSNEYYEINKGYAEREVQIYNALLKLYPDNLDYKQKLATAETNLQGIEITHNNEQKKLNKQEQTLRAQDVADAETSAKKKAEAYQKMTDEIRKLQNKITLDSKTGLEEDLEQQLQSYEDQKVALKDNYKALQLLEIDNQNQILAIKKKYADKTNEELQTIQDRLYLESFKDAQTKELATLQLTFDKQKKLYAGNNEALAMLTIEFEQQKADIIKKYSDKTADDNAKTAETAFDDQQKLLKETDKYQNESIESQHQDELTALQSWYDSQMELYKNNQEEQKKLTKKYSDETAKIELDNAKKEAASEKEVKKALAQAGLQLAGAAIDSVFSAQTNRLSKEKDAELANKNLTEDQKAAIEKKYAQKQKDIDVEQAIAKGALAILSALGAPFPLNLIEAGVVAGMTAIQISNIENTQYAKGGLIRGKKHANGGAVIEAEDGEYIVNARTMQNPLMAQEVMNLNSAGNSGASLPTKPITTDNQNNNNNLAAQIADAVKSIDFRVSANRITYQQDRTKVIESRFVLH
jgi:hypothetical protein